MIQMTLNEAAQLLQIPSPKTNVEFHGITTDTRNLKPGNLFIAIRGARVDGHDLLAEAKQQGAAAALVTQLMPIDLPQLVASDVIAALGQLTAAWRKRFNLPMIAVTGSNGKTTSKNMIAAILIAACQAHSHEVLATSGNHNNFIGLPLTLAQLNSQHRYAVIEMGMNHFGEIAYLTQLTQPNVALITNAAAAHIEGVGDVSGVARAKGEIFQGLDKTGTAILNRDDTFFDYWRHLIGQHNFLSFGTHPSAHVRAQLSSTTTVSIETPQGQITMKPTLLGQHNVMNMLGATAAALAAGIDLAAIKIGLENVAPASGRLQLHQLKNNIKIIDDTYNANPFSLKAAIETLAAFNGKKILVLGDMKELGEQTQTLHQAAGENIKQAGIDLLFTYGEWTENTAKSFGHGAYHFKEQEPLINALKPFLCEPTTVLVKGSRSMRMEKIVATLVASKD